MRSGWVGLHPHGEPSDPLPKKTIRGGHGGDYTFSGFRGDMVPA